MKLDEAFPLQLESLSALKVKGLQAAVVGGTGGVGRTIARALASCGAKVTVVGQTFRDRDVAGLDFIHADLSSMKEAQRVAKLLPAEKLDLLVLTTGVMAGPQREVTAEGIENDMAISYLSRLVILQEVAPRIGQGRPAGSKRPRIFIMGYPGAGMEGTLGDLNADRAYNNWTVHRNTVVGNEVLVLDGVERYPGVDIYGLNPGFVRTNIRAKMFGRRTFLKSVMETLTKPMTLTPEAYAERIVPLLVAPPLESRSGAMFNNKAQAILPTQKLKVDAAYRDEFLSQSEAILAQRAGLKV